MNKIEVVELSASWCGPCKVMKPTIEKIMAMEKFKEIPFKEIDVDDDTEEYSEKYKVRNIPTILILSEEGILKERITGLVPEAKIIESIENKMSEKDKEIETVKPN